MSEISLVRVTPPAGVDCTRASLSYGRNVMVKLCRDLTSPRVIDRQRAVMSLVNLLHEPERHGATLEAGVPRQLMTLVRDARDDFTRVTSVQCFTVLASTATSRAALLRLGLVECLLPYVTVTSSSYKLRLSIYLFIERLSHQVGSDRRLVKFLPVLCAQISRETQSEPRVALLTIVHLTLQHCPEEGLRTPALMDTCRTLLDSDITHCSVKTAAAKLLQDLCLSVHGRDMALRRGLVPTLLRALTIESDLRCKAEVTMALTFVAQSNQGKLTVSAHLSKWSADIVGLLAHPGPDHWPRHAALTFMSVMREVPEVRRQLLHSRLGKMLDILAAQRPIDGSLFIEGKFFE